MRACLEANVQSRLTADRRGRLRVSIDSDEIGDGYARELLRNVERVLDCYRDPGVRIEEYHPVPEGSKVPPPGGKIVGEYAGLPIRMIDGKPNPSEIVLADSPKPTAAQASEAKEKATKPAKPSNRG